MSHYLVLGVPEDADAETIHSAFRARARQYHPDAGEGSSAGKFREVVDAYETLSDPARRRDYDRTLRPQPMPNRITREGVMVEPLTQQWFYSPFGSAAQRPVSMHTVPIRALEDWFDEIFRLFDREFFSDPWF